MSEKQNINNYPVHMRGDIQTRNDNIDAERGLCNRCEGTGNELYSMYRKCQKCFGKGWLEEDEKHPDYD